MKANPCTKTWEADVLVFAPPSFRLNESESGLVAIPYLKCEFLPFMSRVEIFVGFFVVTVVSKLPVRSCGLKRYIHLQGWDEWTG